ncbi:hypothetical protein BS47DRAFT_170619 [Hydnum rufescens UP504]|uniref:C2H2-type domain-containing protein n=1 Tax=Hydnum rufescens UP504 TaxID=1448309 RepID=A0A9P6B7P2_9AGAM|nr:hypothetical protein BS47DRAFT_170619 [Hydnum rufescens UP504]
MRTGRKSHPCLECNSIFDRPSALKQHMSRHTGEKAHTCTMCHKSFSVLSNLRRHMKTCGTLGRRRGRAVPTRVLTSPDVHNGRSLHPHPFDSPSSNFSPGARPYSHSYNNPHATIDSDLTPSPAMASWLPASPEPIRDSLSSFPNPAISNQTDEPLHWNSMAQLPLPWYPSTASHSRNCSSILRDSLRFLPANQDTHSGPGVEYWSGEFDYPNPRYTYYSTSGTFPSQPVVSTDRAVVHDDGSFAKHVGMGSYY